jgi:hypothetical protein
MSRGDNLFKVREDEDRELLSEEMAKKFHRTVAQLLFLCKRARPDIETLISFLTTRVKQPDKDDWGKLRHGLMYLKGTLYMKRYLTADNLSNIVWWVDGSFGVHWDSRGHTGAMMSMGKGAIVNIARKHKMNVASSTESELVSIADVLGMILWCKYFMEAQGYTIESNLLYQDNKSTILLAKNGRMSAGKNSKHIKNRFFLITDKVAQGDLTIQHMGTKTMWADVNTKPVQGLLFRKFRHEMMGVPVEYDDDVERRNTHPMLMPKIENERLTIPETELLKEIAVLAPEKRKTNAKRIPKRGITRSGDSKSISPRTGATAKRRSVLGEDKYGPGSGPQWKTGGTRYPNLYKALLEEPSRIRRTKLLEDNSRAEVGDGRIIRRPARARIRNQ